MTTRIALLVLICLLIAGCSSPKTRYYTLQAPAAPAVPGAVADASQSGVLVGPVTLPDAVDRNQFVLRTGDNTVDISDANRWAEPLKSQIVRVLVANLSQLLGGMRVSAMGTGAANEQDFRVSLDIQSFESTLGGSAAIEARWTISRAKGKPLSGRSVVREPLDGAGYEALAAGHGRALAQISREIAEAIRGAGRP